MPQPKSGLTEFQVEAIARHFIVAQWGQRKGEKRLEAYMIARYGDEKRKIPANLSIEPMAKKLGMNRVTLKRWLTDCIELLAEPLEKARPKDPPTLPEGHEGETFTDEVLAGDTRQISGHEAATPLDPNKLVGICGRSIDSLQFV
jgi:hypothetical protein